jgi:penicillin-binding protein 2
VKIADRAREGRELKTRIAWLGVAVVFCFLALAGRLWFLQIRKGEEYAHKSEGNFIKELRVPADRGMILDRKGKTLVDSRPSYDLYITPAFCGQCEDVVGRLAGMIQLEGEDLTRVLDGLGKSRGLERFRPIPVRVDINRDELDVVEANRDSLPGLDVIAAPHRNYREGPLAGHLLGYLGEIGPDELAKSKETDRPYRLGDYIGKRGVERKFEEYLRGEDGAERVVADAKGRKLPELEWMIPETDRYQPGRPGHNLVLSIDERLQRTAEENFNGEAGSLVAVDVNTGFVLAMVSKPGYDPNEMTGRISKERLRELSQDPLEPMLFRATQNHFHPGSTFKVITELAALERGIKGTVFCGGGYTLGRRRWRCHKDSGHGSVDPMQAIQKSCDTWFYSAADRMGIDAISDMAHRFGLGSPTGLDLGFEVPGVIPSVEYHDKYTPGGYQKGFALNAAIGQGDVNVTPLQLAMVYAAIANGGTVYRPQVVRRIEDADGTVVKAFEPEARLQAGVPPATLAIVRKGLDMVVNEPGGTAYSKRLKNIRVAGKTGTAQVVRIGAKRVKKEEMGFFERDHAWYAAYAPVEDPQIAVVVLNEHGGHGGSDAAPAGMKVIERYFELLEEDRAPESFRRPADDEAAPVPAKAGSAPAGAGPGFVPPDGNGRGATG